MTLELSILDRVEELEQHREAWQDLLARSEAAAPMLGPDWLITWWGVFGAADGRKLRVGLFRDGRRLVGVAPLSLRRHVYRSCIPFRRLESLGTGESEVDEICSEYVGLLAHRGFESAVARTLARALGENRFGRWDELVMPSMNAETSVPRLLHDELGRCGIPTTSRVVTKAPYIPLPATWSEYLAALSPSHRGLVRRSLQAFDDWSGGAYELDCVRSRDDLDRGFEALRSLHTERWSHDNPGGLFASARFTAFHRGVMPKMLASGALELLTLLVRSEPVAVQYNLIQDGRVYFYQGGRRLDVPRGIRPGTVLHALAIQRAIAAGRTEYDFLAGTQRYKLELSLAARPVVELRAVRPVVVEVARRAAELGAARARSFRARFDRLGGWPFGRSARAGVPGT